MSIFLSGNNVTSQPFVSKWINNNKPPTDLSLPLDVDYLLPENGGAAVGSITNNTSLPCSLIVVMAGESDLNNQVVYSLQPYQTLNAQIRYISSASTVDGDPIADYYNDFVASVSLSSTSTITAPFYNFSVDVDWKAMWGPSALPNQADFEGWFTNTGMGIITLTNYTVSYSKYLDVNGSPVTHISCNLEYDGKSTSYRFDNYFYEINGLGLNVGDKNSSVNINQNDNLVALNCYYGNLNTTNLLIQRNGCLEYIDGNIFKDSIITDNLTIYQCYDLKGFVNFTQFPGDIQYMYCYDNGLYVETDSRGIDRYRNCLRWDYDMTNLTNIQNIYLSSNGLNYFDYSLLPNGSDYNLNLSQNNLTEFSPVSMPDTINSLDLGENRISIFKPQMLPHNLTYLGLYNNELSNIDVDFAWGDTNVADLDLGGNFISRLNQSLKSINNVYLQSNLLYDWDNYVQFTKDNQTELSLSVNKFTTLPGNLPYPNLTGIFLSDNEITTISSDLTYYTNLQYLYLQNNKLIGTVTINASSNLTYFYINNNPLSYINFVGTYPNLYSINLNKTAIVSLTGNLATKLPNLQEVILQYCFALESITATFSATTYLFNIQNCSLTTFNPVAPGAYNIYIYNTSIKTFNWTIPTVAGSPFYNISISDNPLLTSLTTSNIPSLAGVFFNNNPLLSSVNLGTSGAQYPYYIGLQYNNMSVASWTAMNTWANTIIGTWSGKQFYAYGNPGSITGTTTATTLASKLITVYP